MRWILNLGIVFLCSLMMASGNLNDSLEWISFEEAVDKGKTGEKKIFIDVYTDWCGWCKKMDASTFSDPSVAKILGKHFYNVKLDAEQKEPINFNQYTFKYVPNGRRGYHELAASLLNGKLSYPTVVFLNEKFEIIQVLPGYRNADEFLKIATFIGEDHYLTTPWSEYVNSLDKKIGTSGD